MTETCPGPVPPGKPRLKTPPGACDSHVHVIGPYDRFPLNENRGYTAPESTFEDYQRLMESLGLERAVIVHASAYGTMLGVTEDAVMRLGDQGRGVAVVDPDISDSELDRLHEIGFRGLRFTTLLRGGTGIENVPHMADRIKRLGWHVQIFVHGGTELESILPMLAALPVDAVIDHIGHFKLSEGVDHPAFRALVEHVRGGRCWVKLSGQYRISETGAPFTDVPPMAEALLEARPDRMVWATDWPHVMLWDRPMPSDADILDWIGSWGVDDATIRRVLADNPAELYGFG
ncbi:MAG: amidohydrolase family protein [Rhodospirillales bacterium]|nr:amidohydrolase family protein [Rhodospirillales bacterium]